MGEPPDDRLNLGGTNQLHRPTIALHVSRLRHSNPLNCTPITGNMFGLQGGVPPVGRTRLLCGQGFGVVMVVVLPFDW